MQRLEARDARGRLIEVGDWVIYGTRYGSSSVILKIAEVVEIHYKKKTQYNYSTQTHFDVESPVLKCFRLDETLKTVTSNKQSLNDYSRYIVIKKSELSSFIL